MLCPCDSGKQFTSCCLPIINGEKYAISPEQLMRSRFSAYVSKNTQYIFNSYALSSQKSQSIEDIKSWANNCHFIKLTIHSTSPFTDEHLAQDSLLPTVEFTALYRVADRLYQMTEKSRFIKESQTNSQQVLRDSQWVYLDGDVDDHQLVTKIKRNDPCPCKANEIKTVKKKFKKCCGSQL